MGLGQVQPGSEENSTPVTDGADFTVTAGTRYYAFITLPSTYPFYTITGLEWKNGATVAGNVLCGIDIVDADPPTLASTPLVALGMQVAQSGTSVVQRNSNIKAWFPGGTLLGCWISLSDGTAKVREQTGLGSQNQLKTVGAYTSTPATNEVTAWSTATARKYIKLYYKGYQ